MDWVSLSPEEFNVLDGEAMKPLCMCRRCLWGTPLLHTAGKSAYAWHALSQTILRKTVLTASLAKDSVPAFKLGGPHLVRGCVGTKEETLNCGDIEQSYIKACAAAPAGAKVIAQNTQ